MRRRSLFLPLLELACRILFVFPNDDLYLQNHDSDINITRAGEIAREIAISPWSYTRFSPPGVGGTGGPGNYWVPVYEETTGKSTRDKLSIKFPNRPCFSDHAPVLVLWFFDSRGMWVVLHRLNGTEGCLRRVVHERHSHARLGRFERRYMDPKRDRENGYRLGTVRTTKCTRLRPHTTVDILFCPKSTFADSTQ